MKKIVVMILIATLLLCGCSKKQQVTGPEWLLMQQEGIDELIEFSEYMDEIYALYFTGKMLPADFKNEIILLNETYNVMRAQYEENKKLHPIKPESHTFISKKGSDAVDSLRDAFQKVILNAVDENGEPRSIDEVSYMYLAYRDECVKHLAEYITSIEFLMNAEEYAKESEGN